MEHHADFAIPVSHVMRVTTVAQPEDEHGPVAGQVIALGWWVQPETANDPSHEPVGTLYLVVDDRRPRPLWIRQGDLRSVQIDPKWGEPSASLPRSNLSRSGSDSSGAAAAPGSNPPSAEG